MLNLRERTKELKEELNDAEKFKHDLKNKYEHLTKEETKDMSIQLKRRIRHTKNIFDKAEKEAKDLKTRVSNAVEQGYKIKAKHGEPS